MSRLLRWLDSHSLYSHTAAPIWLRIPEKQRWTIVHWLNKSRRRCWADLVSDALTIREDDSCDTHVPGIRGADARGCASQCGWSHREHTSDHDCSCYCGKFQFVASSGARDHARDGA